MPAAPSPRHPAPASSSPTPSSPPSQPSPANRREPTTFLLATALCAHLVNGRPVANAKDIVATVVSAEEIGLSLSPNAIWESLSQYNSLLHLTHTAQIFHSPAHPDRITSLIRADIFNGNAFSTAAVKAAVSLLRRESAALGRPLVLVADLFRLFSLRHIADELLGPVALPITPAPPTPPVTSTTPSTPPTTPEPLHATGDAQSSPPLLESASSRPPTLVEAAGSSSSPATRGRRSRPASK